MYDGTATGLVHLVGTMASPTHYAGHLDQIAGGQTMTGPSKAPTTVTPVGFIAIDFASLETGTILLSDAALKTLVTIPMTPADRTGRSRAGGELGRDLLRER